MRRRATCTTVLIPGEKSLGKNEKRFRKMESVSQSIEARTVNFVPFYFAKSFKLKAKVSGRHAEASKHTEQQEKWAITS